MRKNQMQKLILAITEILDREEKNVERQMDVTEAQWLQEKAISVGHWLEEDIGQDTDEVHMLEEYCERVYQACVGNEYGRAAYKDRKDMLELLLQKVKQNIPLERNKILFIPYKYCMWDSMESIYESALKDKAEWEIIIMPVPFRLKKENRIVYEGELFREKNGFRSYLEYELEEECPDVIIIHNPYDQYNKLTEVDKRYFSEELKKYTNHLVYIPYFAAQRNLTKIDKIILPGVRNATDIFVQSEKIKKEYLRWYPDKNVQALGCPKIDRIVNGDAVIEGKKRTFLLNTHLNMVRSAPDLLIERVNLILCFFAKHPQYELIWRPHPLSQSCFEDLKQKTEYEKKIEYAKTLDNVQYDESEDFFEAVLKADAYIGDISSLVLFFGIMGKPIYLFEREEKNLYCWDEYLSFLDYEFCQGKIWVAGRKTPGIFSMDRQLANVKLEYNLVQYRKDKPYRSYLTVRIKEKEMYVFFENQPCVEKIDMKTGEEKEVKFEDGGKAISANSYIVQDIYEYDGFYYIIPASAGAPLLRFDGEKLAECAGWKEQMVEILGEEQKHWLDGCAYKDNEVWFVVPDTNLLMRTDLVNFEITEWNVGDGQCRLETVAYDGQKFWLVGSGQRAIFQWSIEKGLEKIYDNFPPQILLGTKFSFIKIVFYKESVWLIPGSASDILILDRHTGKCRTLELPELIWLEDTDRLQNMKFYAVLQQDDRLFLFAHGTRQHIIIDMKQERIIGKLDTLIAEEDLKEIQKRFLINYNECTSDVCRVSDYITFVDRYYNISEEERKHYLQGMENIGNSGMRIWEEIKKWYSVAPEKW